MRQRRRLIFKMGAPIELFQNLDVRVGKVVKVDDFPEAKRPAYKLTIDFGGGIGIKKSSVQIVKNYDKDSLKEKLVFGVVNLPPRKIGPFISEVLTLGVPDEKGECILAVPDKSVPIGG